MLRCCGVFGDYVLLDSRCGTNSKNLNILAQGAHIQQCSSQSTEVQVRDSEAVNLDTSSQFMHAMP
jgi:hypothetical protein